MPAAASRAAERAISEPTASTFVTASLPPGLGSAQVSAMPGLLPLLLASALATDPGPDVGHFTIVDAVAPVELAETTQIYVDDRLVASFRLGGDGRKRVVVSDAVADPDAPHRYAICGTITVASPGHAPETHQVDSSGVIADVEGRQYEALGAADFTFFYLADEAPGRIPAAPSRRPSALCHPPLS